jgi:hypothetical protein
VKVWEINHEKGEVLAEEIAHLKSFGWSDTRVAERLGITVSAIETVRSGGECWVRPGRCYQHRPGRLATPTG